MNKITASYELGSKSKQFLRDQAELIVSGKRTLSEQNLETLSPAATRELVHELQVHQIELEMQNETLRQTQLQLVAMQARYFDLYDLAPISYCTVNETGIILEANLATAELLGESRNSLVGQRISRYICKESQDNYYLSRKLLSAKNTRQTCDLHIVKADNTDFWAHISISAAKASNGDTMLRMVLTDITNAKVLTMAMTESESHLRTLVNNIPRY